jgi:hypothetical protein
MVAWIPGRRSLTEVVQIYVLWNAEIVVNQDPAKNTEVGAVPGGKIL